MNPEASTLAVLLDPSKAHPVWFCEVVEAVKRRKMGTDDLTYEKVALAIDCWREERSNDR